MSQALRVSIWMLALSALSLRLYATIISVELPVPAEGFAGQPALSRGADGLIRLSWVESRAEGKYALRSSRLGTRQWEAPIELAAGEEWFVNWADIPRVSASADGRLLFSWLEDLGEQKYAYGVRAAVADARAQRISEAFWLHDDQSPTEHGFVSLQPMGVDRTLAIWLDGRRMADGVDAFDRPLPASHDMQLRSALLSSTGEKLRENILDPRTCECCPTSLCVDGSEAFAVWRDRSPTDIRNIAIARWDGQAWTEPKPVHDDAWKVPGCPVNGPAIAIQGDRLAVAWFTAPDDEPQMRFASGNRGDLEFTAPLIWDRRKAMGRVDLELDADGNAHVLWLSTLDAARAVLLWATIAPDGTMSAPETVTTMEASRAIGLPQLMLVEGAAIVVWTEGDANKSRIRCLQLRRGDAG